MLKRLAILSTAFIALSSYTPLKKDYVYLCDSKSSYAYHIDPNCRGLGHCKHGVFKTTKDSAINYYGRTACKICSK